MKEFFSAILNVLKSIFTLKKSQPIQNPIAVEDQAQKLTEPAPVLELDANKPKMSPVIDVLKICIHKYENLRETNGKNRSPMIDQILKNQKGALGSAYCAYGACQLLDDVVAAYASQGIKVKFDIPKTGSSQTMWAQAKAEYKMDTPKPASIVIWKHMSGSWTGHVGTCLSTLEHGEFKTFEFNTSGGSTAVVRDGEGAYYRTRMMKDVGDMHILGFIDLEKAMKIL